MPLDTQTYTLIEDNSALADFGNQHKNVDWICFDTEFVGEKRFVTALCLIQIASEHGIYIIDSLKIKDLTPLLELIENEQITKITHAGENDFRLLNILFGTIPKNTFDTQIAAGFLGYKYPVSFRKLVESEMNVYLKKGYTVTNWEARPISNKQIKYALDDVLYLYELWQKLKNRLEKWGRFSWAEDEFKIYESKEYYVQPPHKEAFNSNLIKSLQPRDQLFLIRMYEWRTSEARRKDYSREMILPNKLINPILRAVSSGKEALKANRRLPEKVIARYGDIFVELYNRKPTEEEKELLKLVPRDNSENPKQDVINEILHQMIKYKCLEENLSINIAMSRTILKKMKSDKNFQSQKIEDSWRREFLGEEIISWIRHRNSLKIVVGEGGFKMTMD